jgi:hypothetical protein
VDSDSESESRRSYFTRSPVCAQFGFDSWASDGEACLDNLFHDESDQSIKTDFEDFARELYTLIADVRASAGLLSEIVCGASCDGSGHAGEIPLFILEIIERRDDTDMKAIDPFTTILTIMKQNNLKIVAGVDLGEVSKFVDLIQLSETSPEQKKSQSQWDLFSFPLLIRFYELLEIGAQIKHIFWKRILFGRSGM